MRIAAVQLNSGGEKPRNAEAAERLVRAAAADGAELIALPEKWNLLAAGEEMAAGAEDLDDPSLGAARGWARERFVAADIDLAAQDEVRERLPSLANRRPEAYRWPAPRGAGA